VQGYQLLVRGFEAGAVFDDLEDFMEYARELSSEIEATIRKGRYKYDSRAVITGMNILAFSDEPF